MRRKTGSGMARAPRVLAGTAKALAVAGLILTGAIGAGASAQATATGDTRSYDDDLLRLSEILGSVHYLRAVCGGNDGQQWRQIAAELIRAEGTSALRRATIAQRFNRGYRNYRRTYRRCTPSARSSIARFVKEARELSNRLIKLAE